MVTLEDALKIIAAAEKKAKEHGGRLACQM
jgi:hypothetical protein